MTGSCGALGQRESVIIVAGPTASGKSAFAIDLATRINAEIINIDSVQIYQDFRIGAATVDSSEMRGVKHHLLGTFQPSCRLNVAQYLTHAKEAIDDIHSRGKRVIFVGGTTLYITHLLQGLAALPAADSKLRAELEALTNNELMQRLVVCDPHSAAQLHINDRRRVIRAIETTILSGSPASETRRMHGYSDSGLCTACIFLLCVDRRQLYERINHRTEMMLRNGLIDETQALLERYGSNCPGLASLGYSECIKYLNAEVPYEQLASLISMNTRRFAKRQMTFWRNEPLKRGWKTLPVDSNVQLRQTTEKDFSCLNWTMQQTVDYASQFLALDKPQTEVVYLASNP